MRKLKVSLQQNVAKNFTHQKVMAVVAVGTCLAASACSSNSDGEGAKSSAESAVASHTASASGSSEASQSKGSSAESSAGANGGSSNKSATGAEGITLTASQVSDLKPGEKVDISLTGLDPDGGYYLAVCSKEKTGIVPDCLGAHEDEDAQKWISNKYKPDSIPDSGDSKTELTMTQKGESMSGTPIDCTKDQCVIKLFGDHDNGFVDYVDLPVSFAS